MMIIVKVKMIKFMIILFLTRVPELLKEKIINVLGKGHGRTGYSHVKLLDLMLTSYHQEQEL